MKNLASVVKLLTRRKLTLKFIAESIAILWTSQTLKPTLVLPFF